MTVHTHASRACSNRECIGPPRYISSDRMRYNHRDDIVISFPSANRRLVIVEVFLDVTSSGGSSIDRSITNHGNMNSQGLLIFCDRVHSNGYSWPAIEIVLMYEVSWIAKINKKFLLEMGIICGDLCENLREFVEIEFENLRGLNFD